MDAMSRRRSSDGSLRLKSKTRSAGDANCRKVHTSEPQRTRYQGSYPEHEAYVISGEVQSENHPTRLEEVRCSHRVGKWTVGDQGATKAAQMLDLMRAVALI